MPGERDDTCREAAERLEGDLAVVDALGERGSREALQALVCLAHQREASAVCVRAQSVLCAAAARSGVSAGDLEDLLLPDVEVPPGALVTLTLGDRFLVSQKGHGQGLPASARPALDALPFVLERLTERLALGPPMPALTFTELWGQHPLLDALAALVVWGVFRDGRCVSWFVPRLTPTPKLEDGDGVRPLHACELTKEERLRLRALLLPQPILQLRRHTEPSSGGTFHTSGGLGVEDLLPGYAPFGWTLEERDWKPRLVLQRYDWRAELTVTKRSAMGRAALRVEGPSPERIHCELFWRLVLVTGPVGLLRRAPLADSPPRNDMSMEGSP